MRVDTGSRIADIVLGLLIVHTVADRCATADDDLPRRGFLGMAVAPLTDETRRERGIEDEGGLLVQAVIPGSSAEEAGIKPNDVMVGLDGKAVAVPAEFVAHVKGVSPGKEVKIEIIRNGEPATIAVQLKELPRETSDDYEVHYGSVESLGKRLRTVVTRPPGEGPHPAVFVIQGLGNGSVEQPLPGPPNAYRVIVDHFSRRGFATLRVDKPGCGDSQGGPPEDTTFETEVDAYRQALGWFRDLDFVDEDNILIVGLSMGGVTGPAIADEIPVKGIATWGTLAKTWTEYMLENSRRQEALAGTPFPEIDSMLRKLAAMFHYVDREKQSPAEVAEAHPELRDVVESVYQDHHYLSGRHYTFFQQLADQNLAEAWSNYDGDVLALWGEADYVATREDQELIARIVNASHSGRAAFRVVEDTDHSMNRASTFEESFADSRRPGASEFNPAFLEILVEWAEDVVGHAPSQAATETSLK